MFRPIDKAEVPFGERRSTAFRIAADLKAGGQYAVAAFRAGQGGWGVITRDWA